MTTPLTHELYQWNALDKQTRECFTKLQTLRQNRKSLASKITMQLSEKGHKPGTVLRFEGESLRFTHTHVLNPLTVGAVRRGLARCIEGEDNITAIMAVIQEERGKSSALDLKRLRS